MSCAVGGVGSIPCPDDWFRIISQPDNTFQSGKKKEEQN